MRIAIIGAGIAGNGAAAALAHAGFDITVYEREPRPGGHSATLDIAYDGAPIAVDTGFIVYNEGNYPNLTRAFAALGVPTKQSSMSFSVSIDGGRLEWAGRETAVFGGLFAQRGNIVSPGFLGMLTQVLRFQRQAKADRRIGALAGSLGDYLDAHRFSARLRDHYVLPMGAAIWSMSASAVLDFPVESFVAFFDNHRLLDWERPRWRTVEGGSRVYVEKLQRPFARAVRLNARVAAVNRLAAGVEVVDAQGGRDVFDEVVIATHAPQALAMLGAPTPDERAVLGAMRTSDNAVVLHRDPALMPRRRAAWAAWNTLADTRRPDAPVCVTYWMNALQGIPADKPLFVSLNPPIEPQPELTFARMSYAHPQFDPAAIAAQKRLDSIQGRDRIWFCGAWTAYGFHEDGLASGLAVAARLGGVAPWAASALPLAAE